MSEYDSNLPIIKRLLTEHLKPYKKQLLLAIFFMIIVAICSAVIVNLVKPAIDQIFFLNNKKQLIFLSAAMLGIHTIKGIAEYFQSYLIKYVGQMVLTDLQLKMYKHLLCSDLSFIQTSSSGRLISRFTNDVTLMRGAVSNLIVGCAKHFLSVLFLIIIMFKLEPVLSCIVFFFFPVAIFPIQMLGRKMRNIFKLSQEELSHYTAKLDETFHSIKIIKSFSAEEQEAQRAGQYTTKILRFYKKAARLDSLVSPIMEIFSGLAIGSIILYGGSMVVEGKNTPGQLMAFLVAFSSAYRPFKSLVSLNVNLQEGVTAAKRIFDLFDLKPSIVSLPNASCPSFENAEIKFENVELKFDKKIALKSLDLNIKANKVTAIVGRSGSGKTSIANLLVRFYDSTHGNVLIGDEKITNIDLTHLRKQIALVTQDTFLFDLTIYENIAFGNQEASKEEIINASKYADAHSFIINLPDGYDTLIGAQGITLSGGQRQKLSLARAFLKDSKILILDEGTSSLDQSSEQQIFQSLAENICQNKTVIIITHRLASIKDANEIIVMKAGKVVEIGTHQSLLEKKGEYYRLYTRELINETK